MAGMFNFWKKKKTEDIYGPLYADMHSHLIPGIDDGSPDMETSLAMIEALREAGFRKLITTPHIMWDMYKNTAPGILAGLEELKKEVDARGIDVEVSAAAEYFLDDYVKELLRKKEPLLTVSKNMVLVEFSLASPPLDLKELLFEMQLQGYLPIIAHPERYIYSERNKTFFTELKAAGYLFQLNLFSLGGIYGKATANLAHFLLKNDFMTWWAPTYITNDNWMLFLILPYFPLYPRYSKKKIIKSFFMIPEQMIWCNCILSI
ncbi:MAG: hypothetical protein HC867_01705 [Bacteroidia bacterium]|nr:hypothetical protein [Bacteroidia bacterium]